VARLLARGGFDPSVFPISATLTSSAACLSATSRRLTPRRPQRGADLRYDLEIPFEEAASGTETTIQIPRQETCQTCSGSGAAPGTEPITCPQCRGQGQIRSQQGFFTVSRTCPQCRGLGRVIAKPCTSAAARRAAPRERKLTVKIPLADVGQQLRLTGEGEADLWAAWADTSRRRPRQGSRFLPP
jgi:DnaJ-class molecular chaperone